MENDLISRSALVNVILNDRKLDGVNANWEVNRILVHIHKAPTVEQPQGEWIEGTQGHYCSICYEIDYSYYEHNYCPYCGAKMKQG